MRYLLAVILVCCLTPSLSATANCFAHTAIPYTATSAAMNDTGANMLIAFTASYSGFAMVQDVVGGPNTWRVIGSYTGANTAYYFTISIAINPVTNTAATFKHVGGSSISLSGSQVWACSGVNVYDPVYALTPNLLQEANPTGQTCQAPNAIGAYAVGDLEFTAASRSGPGQPGTGGYTATNDGTGFSTPTIIGGALVGNEGSVALAWKVSTDLSTFRPTWTMSTSDHWTCLNIVIKASTSYPISSGNPFVKIIAGNGYQNYTGDGGAPTAATLNWPSEMLWYVDPAHVIPADTMLVFVDNQNNVVRAANYDTVSHTLAGVTIAANTIQTIAGTGTQTCSGSGGAALSATMSHPVGLAEDTLGGLAVADQQCASIDYIDTSGNFSYIAGGCSVLGTCSGGVPNNNCGGASHPYHGNRINVNATTSALISCPQGVAFDSNNNLIVADSSNYRIDFVNRTGSSVNAYAQSSIPSGNIVAIAGGTNACGVTTTPQLANPGTSAIGVRQVLSMFVNQSNGDAYFGGDCNQIIKLTSAGYVVSLAGTGPGTEGSEFSPDGSTAATSPMSAAFRATLEPDGLVHFTDTQNNLMRHIDGSGKLQTEMGDYGKFGWKVSYAGGGFFGDNWSSTLAALNYPIGYAYKSTGELCISSLMSDVIFCQYNASSTLTITKSGTGTGTVTSSDSIINCGSTCSHVYAPGTLITLFPTPSGGSQFSGWSGDCSSFGTGSCTTSMPVSTSSNAQFDLISIVLKLLGKVKVKGKLVAQ